MTFTENLNILFTFPPYFITNVEYNIGGEIPRLDLRQVVNNFINSPQDFESARKYVGGYTSDHTDEFGKRTVSQLYEFGSYPIESLELSDYKKSSVQEFKNNFEKMLSDVLDKHKQSSDYKVFLNNASQIFQVVENLEFYLFCPDKSKHNYIGAFDIDDFICGFAIDIENNKLNVIEVAVD